MNFARKSGSIGAASKHRPSLSAASLTLVVAASLFCATLSWAGSDSTPARVQATGLLPSDPTVVQTYPGVQLHRGFVAVDKMDLTSAMPPPGYQGEIGSCAAWAAVYGAASYYARREIWDPDLKLSPAYVYNQVHHKPGTCDGSTLDEILTVMKKKGSTKHDDFPDALFCSPDEKAIESAQVAFHIPGFKRLANAPYDENGKRTVFTPVDIDLLRQTLADGDPVIGAFNISKAELDKAKAGKIYTAHAAGDPKQEPAGHAMVIVGYDNQKQAFKYMNSWGSDWGEGGYGWMSYDSIKSELIQAYSISSDSSAPEPEPKPDDKANPDDAGAKCVYLEKTSGPHGFRLDGFVENAQQLENLHSNLPSLAKEFGAHVEIGQVDIRPWPQCEALLTLLKPLTADDRPTLRTLDGRTDLKIGNRFGFELVSPNYPSFLYLIYLQADGQAVNLLPKKGSVREQVAPHTVLRVGDPSVQGPKFKASEPPGKEAVIAVAARSPIAPLEDLEQSGGQYFKAGFDNKDAQGGSAEDRRVLSALNDGLQTQPVLPGKAREISAAIVFMNVER